MNKVMAMLRSFSKEKISFQNLKNMNLTAAGLHALQAVLVIALASSVKGVLPVNTSFLTLDTLASSGSNQVLAPAVHHLFNIHLTYLVAAFFLMSAIAHWLVANNYRKKYESDLKKGINKARWIEYAFSASTMMVAIGLLSGVYDISTLLALFGLTALMSLCGLVMEVHNQTTKKTNWLSFNVGVLAEVLAWAIIVIYMLGAIIWGSGIPTFVYFIYVSLFVLFSCFAVNMYLQYKGKGRWKNYLYGERVYIILSLVAKSVLAWQVFFGALRP
jgi:hypothetical protein